ncbi:putative Branched-chain-amino-acid aminotransferase protein [Naja naja]|nr:putative Branched-chain-amino-acid aminotransferase protein [Naja naja]
MVLRGKTADVLLFAPQRFFSTTFKASDLQIELNKHLKPKPDSSKLVFGKNFTDHMLTVEWSKENGWGKPHIKPFQNLSLHPASSALHYSVELFEGMKAFRGSDQRIRLFRPMLNMERMLQSSLRACLPAFDRSELLECIQQLIRVDQDWVPHSSTASLYIRPILIGTENKVTEIIPPVLRFHFLNYGPTIYVQGEAAKLGCQQVLWLYGDDHQITEVGTMNIFLFWKDQEGDMELVTPPLNGIILPGVTRQSLLDLARKWGEFKVSERSVTMSELIKGLEEKKVKEMFGSGTACVVCPVDRILYQGKNYHIPTMENGPEIAKRFLKELTDIQYGRIRSDWAPEVC